MKVKYYLYYSKDNQLYAYTDEKSISKKFESQRKMKKFHKKVKELSRDEINSIARNFQLNKLELKGLRTMDNLTGKVVECEIALTTNELLVVRHDSFLSSNDIFLEVSWDLNPKIFKKRIQKALRILGCYTVMDDFSKNIPDDDYVVADEVSIFIRRFGKSMKEG